MITLIKLMKLLTMIDYKNKNEHIDFYLIKTIYFKNVDFNAIDIALTEIFTHNKKQICILTLKSGIKVCVPI